MKILEKYNNILLGRIAILAKYLSVLTLNFRNI